MNTTTRKLTEKEYKLMHELFVGKVVDEIGFEKTVELLRDARNTIINANIK